jgi:hypothetical protein
LPYHLGMGRFPGRQIVGFVAIATLSVGCGGAKKAGDTTTSVVPTTATTTTPTTTKLESVRSICAQLLRQRRSLKVSQTNVIRNLKAARAATPPSPEVKTLDAQRLQIQKVLDDADRLFAQLREANGSSACPSS